MPGETRNHTRSEGEYLRSVVDQPGVGPHRGGLGAVGWGIQPADPGDPDEPAYGDAESHYAAKVGHRGNAPQLPHGEGWFPADSFRSGSPSANSERHSACR